MRTRCLPGSDAKIFKKIAVTVERGSLKFEKVISVVDLLILDFFTLLLQSPVVNQICTGQASLLSFTRRPQVVVHTVRQSHALQESWRSVARRIHRQLELVQTLH